MPPSSRGRTRGASPSARFYAAADDLAPLGRARSGPRSTARRSPGWSRRCSASRDDSWLPAPARDGRGGGAARARRPGLERAARARRRRCPSWRRWTAARSPPSCPSTTSAALTSITTGLAPAQHGILGYRMLVGRRRAERAAVVGARRRPPARPVRRAAPHRVPRPAGPGRDQVGVPHDRASPQAHLRGGEFVGWHTTAALVEHCLREVEAGERLVYAYYPGVDRSRTSSACTTGVRRRARGGRRARRRAARRVARARRAARDRRPRQVHLEPRVVDRGARSRAR